MSVQAMSWVWEQSLSEGTDRLVLLAIADQARKDGTHAYPSIRSIAQMANVSVRTVQRAIRHLVELGELRVERKAGGARDLRDDRRPNRYTVLMHGVTAVSPRTDAERARAARSRACRAATDGVTTVSPRDGEAARHSCHPVDGHEVTSVSPREGDTTRHSCHPVDGHEVTSEASRGDNQRVHEVSPVSPDPNKDPNDPNLLAGAARGAGPKKRTIVHPRDEIWDALVDDTLADEVEVVDTADVTELALPAAEILEDPTSPATSPPDSLKTVVGYRTLEDTSEALRTACSASDGKQQRLLPVGDVANVPERPARVRRPRPPDPVWNTLLDVCAVDPTGISRSARGAYNRAVAELRALNATPDEIRTRAAVFRVRWPSASCTPTALARRWAECAPNPAHLPGRRLTRAEAGLARLLTDLTDASR